MRYAKASSAVGLQYTLYHRIDVDYYVSVKFSFLSVCNVYEVVALD